MCGAVYSKKSAGEIIKIVDELFGILKNETTIETSIFRPYQPINIIKQDRNRQFSYKTADQWALLPHWNNSSQFRSRSGKSLTTFNARIENIDTAPTWRGSWQSKRCVVPANLFVERVSKAGHNKKIPYAVGPKDDSIFYLAGLWDYWVDDNTGESISSVAIITTESNDLMNKIGHHRAPVILEDCDVVLKYLDIDTIGDKSLKSAIQQPFVSKGWYAYQISQEINYPDNQSPSIFQPIDNITIST